MSLDGLKRLIVCICIIFYAGSLSASVNPSHTEDERLFKAALIYNFAKFTTWPDGATKQPASLNLCTIGNSQLIDDLKKLHGKNVKGRKVSIASVSRHDSFERCHILYIADNQKRYYKKIIKKLNGKPVLTVSSIKNFANKKGIIQFYRDKGRTRLIINLDAARNAGLEISSRLLILAKVIENQAAP